MDDLTLRNGHLVTFRSYIMLINWEII
jgi:hypothetical protein